MVPLDVTIIDQKIWISERSFGKIIVGVQDTITDEDKMRKKTKGHVEKISSF